MAFRRRQEGFVANAARALRADRRAADGVDPDRCAGPPGDCRLELPGDAEPADDLPPTEIAGSEHHAVMGGRPLDPVERGRRVREPAFSDVESGWRPQIGAWVAGDAGRAFFVTAANTGTLSTTAGSSRRSRQ